MMKSRKEPQRDKIVVKEVRCAYTNIENIKNKLNEVRTVLTEKYDILCITETHLNENLDIDLGKELVVYRSDRKARGGGGVLIGINSKLHSFVIDEIQDTEGYWEILACQVRLRAIGV